MKRTSVQVYQDAHQEWRWRAVALENGEVIGASSEGYVNKWDAVSNAKRLFGNIPLDHKVGYGEHEPDYSAIAEGHHPEDAA